MKRVMVGFFGIWVFVKGRDFRLFKYQKKASGYGRLVQFMEMQYREMGKEQNPEQVRDCTAKGYLFSYNERTHAYR